MKWEYKIEMIHIYSSGSDLLTKRLNELGADRWEAVSLITKAGDTVGILLRHPNPM